MSATSCAIYGYDLCVCFLCMVPVHGTYMSAALVCYLCMVPPCLRPMLGVHVSYSSILPVPTSVVRPRAAPERPYRVEFGSQAQQQIPQPSRNMLSKVAQYVFGM
eukprot:scaffold6687_cov23-Tisochrysis_lutea.AAC.1